MADNATGLNRQYEDPPFGLKGDYMHTGAPGSAGGGGPAGDDVGADRITPPWGPSQASARYPASSGGTLQPGQDEPSMITGGDGGYHDTGAGRGSGEHFKRYPWQQKGGA